MVELPNQTELIHDLLKEKQCVLIILDACRFDYFSLTVGDYLYGSLIKARSPATETLTWLKRTFTSWYDVTYVSANAFVNSKMAVKGFEASKHFKRIIDVWDWGWKRNIYTVPPSEVNKAVLKYMDDKMIIHYIQPHGVWIGKVKLVVSPEERDKMGKRHMDEYIAYKVLKGEIPLPLFKKAYEFNLRLVLEYVTKLIPHLKGKIVVTADHGELLGEHSKFLHPKDFYVPELYEVPWFIVKGVKNG